MLNNIHSQELNNQKKFQLHMGTGSWRLFRRDLNWSIVGRPRGSWEEGLRGQGGIWGEEVRSYLPFGTEVFKYFNKYTAPIIPPDLMLIAINGSCLLGLWC